MSRVEWSSTEDIGGMATWCQCGNVKVSISRGSIGRVRCWLCPRPLAWWQRALDYIKALAR